MAPSFISSRLKNNRLHKNLALQQSTRSRTIIFSQDDGQLPLNNPPYKNRGEFTTDHLLNYLDSGQYDDDACLAESLEEPTEIDESSDLNALWYEDDLWHADDYLRQDTADWIAEIDESTPSEVYGMYVYTSKLSHTMFRLRLGKGRFVFYSTVSLNLTTKGIIAEFSDLMSGETSSYKYPPEVKVDTSSLSDAVHNYLMTMTSAPSLLPSAKLRPQYGIRNGLLITAKYLIGEHVRPDRVHNQLAKYFGKVGSPQRLRINKYVPDWYLTICMSRHTLPHLLLSERVCSCCSPRCQK